MWCAVILANCTIVTPSSVSCIVLPWQQHIVVCWQKQMAACTSSSKALQVVLGNTLLERAGLAKGL